jgi:uncharacterized protein
MSSDQISIPLPAGRVRWLAAGLAAGLLVACVANPAFSPQPIRGADPAIPPEHTISVTGTGQVIISPDIADLRLGVTVTKPTVKAARAAAAEAMTAVIAGLKTLGIADRDLQTTILSLQPVYDYRNTTPRLTGYSLSNSIAVTIRDLDKVGDAIDGALAAGATTLDGVTFRVEDSAAAERQARQAAMAEAKAKAETLATAAGIALAGVASISETVAPVPYPIFYGASGSAPAKDVQTPVQPGTNEVTVTVSVVYLIR